MTIRVRTIPAFLLTPGKIIKLSSGPGNDATKWSEKFCCVIAIRRYGRISTIEAVVLTSEGVKESHLFSNDVEVEVIDQ